MTLQIEVEEANGATVFAVRGTVDIHSSPELRKRLRPALAERASHIVVDLEHVDFVDSSGLATLIEALQRVRGYEGLLVLCNLTKPVVGAFQLANLDQIFRIRESRRAALDETA